jgi:dienelactone hydrolase
MMLLAVACSAATAFVGTLCTPEEPGPRPVVVVLGGSGGGDGLRGIAARFAGRGYVAVSVAYFGLAGLPATLDQIPVETVGNALESVAKRPDVDAARIGVFGDSKGGELALLAAATYPQVHAVVGVVPSPFAWQGAGFGSSWTLGGKPVPYIPVERRRGSAYAESMRAHRGQIGGAMFALEKVHGPMLLLAGDDDAVWDSPAQCEVALAYLRAHPHPYADEYVHYPAAGHAFLFATPDRPLQARFGGTARGNVDAGRQAWSKIDDFLDRALRSKEPPAPSA